MTWQAITFGWNQVHAFLATAEEGSFSGAARVLKTTQPTINGGFGMRQVIDAQSAAASQTPAPKLR